MLSVSSTAEDSKRAAAAAGGGAIGEGDVVRALELPALDGLDLQGVEDLCSALTCRHLAAPLILELVVSQRNYVSALLKRELRAVVESVLFEPLDYGAVALTDDIPAADSSLASPLGVLNCELLASPEALLHPLLRMGDEALRLNGAVGRRASFLVLLLFFVRVAARVARFADRAARAEAEATGEDAAPGAAARSAPLLRALKHCLVQRVAPLLEEWIAFSRRAVFAEGDDGEAQRAETTQRTVRLHAHLALCYAAAIATHPDDRAAREGEGEGELDAADVETLNLCVPRFLRSAAHVVQWHSNIEAVAKRRRAGASGARAAWPDATLELPLAEVFYAQQRSRERVFAWVSAQAAAAEEEEEGAATRGALNQALTSIALHSALRGGRGGGDEAGDDPLLLDWRVASHDVSEEASGAATKAADGASAAGAVATLYGNEFGYARASPAEIAAPAAPSMPMPPAGAAAAMLGKETTSVGGGVLNSVGLRSATSVGVLPKKVVFGPEVEMNGVHLRNAHGEIMLSFNRGQARVASVHIARWRQILRPDGARNPTVVHGSYLVSVNGTHVVSDDSDPQHPTTNLSILIARERVTSASLKLEFTMPAGFTGSIDVALEERLAAGTDAGTPAAAAALDPGAILPRAAAIVLRDAHADLVQKFFDVTSCSDARTARWYLERHGWDVSDAVSCILCTVTYYANLAHNLTRSP
jgi:hypothetical protein